MPTASRSQEGSGGSSRGRSRRARGAVARARRSRFTAESPTRRSSPSTTSCGRPAASFSCTRGSTARCCTERRRPRVRRDVEPGSPHERFRALGPSRGGRGVRCCARRPRGDRRRRLRGRRPVRRVLHLRLRRATHVALRSRRVPTGAVRRRGRTAAGLDAVHGARGVAARGDHRRAHHGVQHRSHAGLVLLDEGPRRTVRGGRLVPRDPRDGGRLGARDPTGPGRALRIDGRAHRGVGTCDGE